MPRCLSEGVDIFLKSADRQGESGHDVRVSRLTPWMASVGGPVIMRKTYSLFVENSHPETRHQGVTFRSPWAFVASSLNFHLPYFFRNQFCPRHSESGAVCYPLGSNVGHACSIIRNRTVSQNILSQKSY